MIDDRKGLSCDPDILCVGFNIGKGILLDEKIYYRQTADDIPKISHDFVKLLYAEVKDLRYFSAERCREKQGSVKYDFQVESIEGWRKAKAFLRGNPAVFDEELVNRIEEIPWLYTMFTTLAVRISDQTGIEKLVLYYRRLPEERACVQPHLERMLPSESAHQCAAMMKLMHGNGAWVRLVALDFDSQRCRLKVYFETEDPSLINLICDKGIEPENRAPLLRVMEYASENQLRFGGIAIVMDIKSNDIRYNLYFAQEIQSGVIE